MCQQLYLMTQTQNSNIWYKNFKLIITQSRAQTRMIFPNQNQTKPELRPILIRRQKTDSMINAYNPHILKAWKANMDIQLVRNVYGVAMYICTYICKSEPEGLKSAIKKVLEQLPNNCSQRKQIHGIGSTVLSHRQISAQEVAFRMTNLPLIESSVKTVFLNCRKPQNRHKILKSKLKRDQLDDDNEDVFETGHADYYCLRPQGELWENMCITTFISWYLLCNSSRHNNHHQPSFQLQNLGKRIRQRSHPACIRMPKIGLHDDNDEYFYSKLYCYLPFRSEMD